MNQRIDGRANACAVKHTITVRKPGDAAQRLFLSVPAAFADTLLL
jgi:hypothetical protein